MTLRIIGAGLGRTGTTSLMVALEKLLARPCYHMAKLSAHPDHIEIFHSMAISNQAPDWSVALKEYAAVTDWPAAAFYESIMAQFPDAKVLLSHRDPEAWYASCEATIFPTILEAQGAWGEMIRAVVYNTFCDKLADKSACIEAYVKHNQEVRKRVPSQRLIEWSPGEGWLPLCEGLDLAIPEDKFPHANTTQDFLSRKKSKG
ncbi:MAG: hypothetical protein MI976_06045 [Pseudomonadales bacterium]|nr:hypothetical protein [Pseudomonadales bacterium]